jgi:integrase
LNANRVRINTLALGLRVPTFHAFREYVEADGVLHMVLRKLGVKSATVHGFRSSFRDWAGNVSNFPREITETALAHVIGDKAEQAYRRSDALEKRRKLMEAWASYCEPKMRSNVLPLRKP